MDDRDYIPLLDVILAQIVRQGRPCPRGTYSAPQIRRFRLACDAD
jgi:hypothetical protein